uniref:DUF7448 domain-containing protein n=1 Tax=viral metagenome TaxID=1070528 RepID=A0A6M3INT0_9ZZZZ
MHALTKGILLGCYLGGVEDMKKQMTTYPKNMTIDTLLGKSLTSIEGDVGTKKITFQTANNETYELSHDQDCREEVCVVDISGDLQDLIKHPILLAEEIISANSVPDEIKYIDQDKYLYGDSFTWTFYKLATIKGSVTIRWLGTSNGYYSESVDFVRIS